MAHRRPSDPLRSAALNLQTGDYFTILTYQEPESSPPTSPSELNFNAPSPARRPIAVGQPLRFRSLSHPFILAELLNHQAQPLCLGLIDTRVCTLTRLTDHFISSMKTFVPSAPPVLYDGSVESPPCPATEDPPQ